MVKRKRRNISAKAIKEYGARNKILKEMGYDSYREYLKSSLWESIKNQTYKLKGKLCLSCLKPAKAIHHAGYDGATLKGDSYEHLYPICKKCHVFAEYTKKKKLSPSEATAKLNLK